MNRKEIRESLRQYDKAKNKLTLLNEKINNDNEIQSLLKNRSTRSMARNLIYERYPKKIDLLLEVSEKEINLIKAMTKSIDDYKNIDVDKVDYKTFNKLLALARKV